MSYVNNKDADQPAHPRSLISAFVVRCPDSVMSLISVTNISNLMLASVAEQASLSQTWSETPEDTFSYDEAQMYVSSYLIYYMVILDSNRNSLEMVCQFPPVKGRLDPNCLACLYQWEQETSQQNHLLPGHLKEKESKQLESD